MSQQTLLLDEALALLNHHRSPKRRSAAKRLRKYKDVSAGPALLRALQREVQDFRTWETQYQMIMALGESQYMPALPYLQALARQSFEATMVYVALGDAIVRLGGADTDNATPVLTIMREGNDMLTNGAFRAVAMLRLQLNPSAVDEIIQYVSDRGPYDGLRLWVAAAAAGWNGAHVQEFLESCATGPRDDVKQAAIAAQAGKYLTWSPL